MYYIYYVKDSSPHLKKFKTEKQADKWLNKFYKTSNGIDNGDWIELYFKGTVYYADENLGSVLR